MLNWLMNTVPDGATYLQVILLSVAVAISLSGLITMVTDGIGDMWRECFPKERDVQ